MLYGGYLCLRRGSFLSWGKAFSHDNHTWYWICLEGLGLWIYIHVSSAKSEGGTAHVWVQESLPELKSSPPPLTFSHHNWALESHTSFFHDDLGSGLHMKRERIQAFPATSSMHEFQWHTSHRVSQQGTSTHLLIAPIASASRYIE